MNKRFWTICIICGLIGTAASIIKRYLYVTRTRQNKGFATLHKYVTNLFD